MADDLESMLGRADGPRALSPELRNRLADVLLAEIAVAEEPDEGFGLDLTDVDADRPLSADLRDRLQRELQSTTRRRPRRQVLIGTAAGIAAVLAAGTAVTVASLSGTADRGTVAGNQAGPTPKPSVTSPPLLTPGRPGKARTGSGKGAVTGGVAGGVGAVPAPTAVADSLTPAHARAQRLSSIAQKRAEFIVNTNSAVLLTHLSPAFGPVEGGTTIVIRGAGLRAVRDVRFDGVRAAWVDARSGRRLSVVTPTGGSIGPADITLRGPGIYIRITDGYTYAYAGVGSWF